MAGHMLFLFIDNCGEHPTGWISKIVGHVVGNMAVKWPNTRIVGHKLNIPGFPGGHQDCVSQQSVVRRNGIAIYGRYGKLMAVYVYRMSLLHGIG